MDPRIDRQAVGTPDPYVQAVESLHKLQKKTFLRRIARCVPHTVFTWKAGPLDVLNVKIDTSMLGAAVIQVQDLGDALIGRYSHIFLVIEPKHSQIRVQPFHGEIGVDEFQLTENAFSDGGWYTGFLTL